MTSTPQACDQVLAELDAWLDGAVPPPARARIELHLETCDDCRTIAEDARALRASPLPALPAPEPPRDLWPDIRARLAAAVEVDRVGSASRSGTLARLDEARSVRRRSAWGTRVQWAAAAIVLVAASSAVTAALMQSPSSVGSVGSPAPVPVTAAPPPTPAEAGTAFASDVQAAAAELSVAVELRRDELDPETLEIVERNLAIIDQAIAETREALSRDPADGRAQGALVSAYNQKVRLLQAVLRTPSTRG